MTRKFTLGCDPEVFLTDARGALVASCGKIGGDKSMPLPLPIGDGFYMLEDNVAIEFNTAPAESKEQFEQAIEKSLTFIRQYVGDTLDLTLSPISAAYFPASELAHPGAFEFGCEPDFNAWKDGQRNPKPQAADRTLRSCGGHIHVGGFADLSREQKIQLVKYCDLFTGVTSVVMDQKGTLRRGLYGGAGAFRYKPYGIEYRTPSNFWITKREYTDWAWDSIAGAVNAFEEGVIDIDKIGPEIIESINNNNLKMAKHLVNVYNLPVVHA